MAFKNLPWEEDEDLVSTPTQSTPQVTEQAAALQAAALEDPSLGSWLEEKDGVKSYHDGEEEDDEPPPPPPVWDPSEDQSEAFSSVMDWVGSAKQDPLVTLGGVAGSGKSFLMGKLAYDLEFILKKRVVYCAPTGKAAIVLRRSLANSNVKNVDVSTIHSLIYVPDVCGKTGRILKWVLRRELEADMIVIDEASMVTREMFQHLSSFDIPILAIGDHKQLPPVGEDTFLMNDPILQLNKIHRQAKGNPIIRLAARARNGASVDALFRSARSFGGDHIFVAKKGAEARKFGDPSKEGLILTYTNNFRTEQNELFREEMLGLDSMDDPQPGETVICLKNHKTDGGELIANGMRGTLTECSSPADGKMWLSVDFGDQVLDMEKEGTVRSMYANAHQFLRPKTFKGWDEVPGVHHNWWTVGSLYDYGAALTCHKSQGSSAANVAILFENWLLRKLSDEDRARWCYTAITRSSDKLMLLDT